MNTGVGTVIGVSVTAFPLFSGRLAPPSSPPFSLQILTLCGGFCSKKNEELWRVKSIGTSEGSNPEQVGPRAKNAAFRVPTGRAGVHVPVRAWRMNVDDDK
nr:hypothetical protein Itr_chr15CG02040 [Ipomoea trifida]